MSKPKRYGINQIMSALGYPKEEKENTKQILLNNIDHGLISNIDKACMFPIDEIERVLGLDEAKKEALINYNKKTHKPKVSSLSHAKISAEIFDNNQIIKELTKRNKELDARRKEIEKIN